MVAKKHKCHACGKIRLDRYMMADTISESKTGKQKVKWICGDCEEENRGRPLKKKGSLMG
jgi:hypothetical protein